MKDDLIKLQKMLIQEIDNNQDITVSERSERVIQSLLILKLEQQLGTEKENCLMLEKRVKELTDRFTPKKLNYEYDGYADGYPVYDIAYCCNCGRCFDVDEEHFKYCPDCGQSLDWEMEKVIEENGSDEDE